MSEYGSTGYAIYKNFPRDLPIREAKRVIWHDLIYGGYDQEDIENMQLETCWAPHARYSEEILSLLPPQLVEGELCDPQVVIQFPDKESGPIEFHTDREPPWAEGRKYLKIVGVALTPQFRGNGGLIVKPMPYMTHQIAVNMEPGDVIVFHPELPHSSGYNLSGDPRMMVYFRFLPSVLTA